jgi:hypothetical protein
VSTIVCACTLAIAQLANVLVCLIDMLHAPARIDRCVAVGMPGSYKAPPNGLELHITHIGVNAQFLVGLSGVHGNGEDFIQQNEGDFLNKFIILDQQYTMVRLIACEQIKKWTSWSASFPAS